MIHHGMSWYHDLLGAQSVQPMTCKKTQGGRGVCIYLEIVYYSLYTHVHIFNHIYRCKMFQTIYQTVH